MPKLIFFSTNGKWETYSLGDMTTIGRHPDQDLQLLDRMVSKEHAEIKKTGNSFMLRDVGSRNGTMLNNILIDGPVVLQDGDEISVGNYILRFSDAPEPVSSISQTSPGGLSEYSMSASSSQPIRKRMRTLFLPESEIHSDLEIRENYEKLRVAVELTDEVASTLNVEQLLNVFADKAFRLFKADRVAILLRDEAGIMQTKLAVDREKRPICHFKISETLLDEVIAERSAVLSGDALTDHRFVSSNSMLMNNVRSTMCVPLIYRDELLGLINLDTQWMTGAFIEKDLDMLTGFARQAAFCLQQIRMVEEMKRNTIIRENMRRVIPPHLVNDVINGKIELHKGGKRTKSTVLFADIRGFSNLTEKNEPEMIVSMLNDFFEVMVTCVFKNDGGLDKFVGDEVMAVWDGSMNEENHALQATQCAIDMMNALSQLNASREEQLLPPIAIGIGVATGLMIAGYMGSTQAMSYTVIGDTVNLAARLCSAAQGGEILVNDEAWRMICGKICGQQLPSIMVKGKEKPVAVYRIQTCNQQPQP